MLQLCALLEKVTVQMHHLAGEMFSSACRQPAGDARPDDRRAGWCEEARELPCLHPRPPTTPRGCSLRTCPAQQPACCRARRIMQSPAGVVSRPRGLLSQLQRPGPFIGHGVRTSQPQARHERPKWCRSHSFGKAGSGLECRPTSRRPVVDANAKSALARCLPTSGAQCRSRDTKRRYQRP